MVDPVVIGDACLYLGDCLEILPNLPKADACITDPPYGLSFMGKRWDYDVPSVEVWAECLRVLKPGGHLLAFAGTRTQHRMAVRIEDAGFEIRDMIAWVYGSGFPKSMDVSKAIDRAAGAARTKVPATGNLHKNTNLNDDGWSKIGDREPLMDSNTPVTDAALQWQGWGTALKPALEPITMARKPLVGTVAANVLEYGTGALNIDGCRVAMSQADNVHDYGRWPANLIHDGSDEVLAGFPESASGAMTTSTRRAAQDAPGSVCYGTYGGNATSRNIAASKGSSARFFYCAKASKSDRGAENIHPTVKPTDLMRYLCRLVTPPGGLVFDPFMGSGSTGVAALREGFKFIGIEREPKYFDIACRRIEQAYKQRPLFEAEQPQKAGQLGLEAE